MRWVRTWPAKIPVGRAYVSDLLPRIEMADYKYVPVLEQIVVAGEDTVIIEWDLAVSLEDRERFTITCAADPDRVHVAAYPLYPVSTGLPEPVWAHRKVGRNPAWITKGEPWCDLFSFGLVYLPHAIVSKYLATAPEVSSDDLFSRWHHREGLGIVPVHWNVTPVHLHY